MTQGKWDNNGDTNFKNGDKLPQADLNDTFEATIPIGAIIPWVKSFTGVPATLPSSYVECNGQVLSDSDSPLDGETIPDLNGDNSFLRGNSTSGGTGGAVSHYHSVHSGSGSVGLYSGGYSGNTSTVSNLPPYYSVVFIMRIK